MRNATGDVPASLIVFFVLGDGESATVYDRVCGPAGFDARRPAAGADQWFALKRIRVNGTDTVATLLARLREERPS